MRVFAAESLPEWGEALRLAGQSSAGNLRIFIRHLYQLMSSFLALRYCSHSRSSSGLLPANSRTP